ncbi:sulfite exporter TauE/SafE family protein [Paracoccus sp. CPCC 101403]|uniref:Probable membrane transporter protein n=1 Tax=Paracoccus broussonetiae TaxID=3075834 RepID=A0ABU3EGZ3_9RHOB|nr:sulfite exporter TauE/SafE family protein [Paracoccus sp. CPCC 101403]MDT1063495.1 sulfite exporter TauE/SafE family protein [Paracoccus sp. CPCC 101403]
MGLDIWGWTLGIVAAFAVGLAKGGLALVGVISVPLMSLVMSPVQAAGILLPVYVVSDIGGLIAFRRSFDRRVLATVLPGALAGIGLGWATAHLIEERYVTLIVGFVGLAFALNALVRPVRNRQARAPQMGAGSFWGALAGYTSFVSHSGGPPYQVYAQPLQMEPMIFAGTTTIFFAICNAVKLVPYAFLGQLSAHNLAVAAALMVPALIGVACGLWILKRMPSTVFYKFITWALGIVSLRLIWTAL